MRQFILRLINTFRPKTADDDLAREVAAHLALLEDEYRRRGLTPDEARLAARRAIGSVAHIKDLHRDSRSFAWLDDLQRDLGHAARMLARESRIHRRGADDARPRHRCVHGSVQRRPRGAAEAAAVSGSRSPRARVRPAAAHRRYRWSGRRGWSISRRRRSRRCDWLTRAFSHVAGYQPTTLTLTGQGDAVRLVGSQVSAAAFPMLGIAPLRGRTFEPRRKPPAPMPSSS